MLSSLVSHNLTGPSVTFGRLLPPTVQLNDDIALPGILGLALNKAHSSETQASYDVLYRPDGRSLPQVVGWIQPGHRDVITLHETKGGVVADTKTVAGLDAWAFAGGEVSDVKDGATVHLNRDPAFELSYKASQAALQATSATHAPLAIQKSFHPPLRDVQACIAVGGNGERLKPLTSNGFPKPALYINGQGDTLIGNIVSQLQGAGCQSVHIATRLQPEAIQQALTHHDPVHLAQEQTALGDFGAFAHSLYKQAHHQPLGPHDPHISMEKPALIVYGDAYLDNLDYANLMKQHQKHNAGLTLLAMEVPKEEASQFGILSVEKDPRDPSRFELTHFVEKPAQPASQLASTGIMVLSPQVLQAIPAMMEAKALHQSGQPVNMGKDLLPEMIQALREGKIIGQDGQPQTAQTLPMEGTWLDVGRHASYLATYRHEEELGDEEALLWPGVEKAPTLQAKGNVIIRPA